MGLLGSNDKPDYVQRFVDTQARGAFASGYEDSATPEITAQDIQKARELGVSVNEAKLMTPAEKAQAKADSLMRSNLLSSMPVYKAKAVESPNLFKLTKDDPINAGILESLWWKMGGETGKPEGVFDALSNSFTRGGYGLANAGNMSEWQVLQEQRKKLRAYDEGIAAGKSNAEVFGDSDFMSADRKRALYDRFRARLWGELERAEKDLAGDIAHTNYVSSLFPQSDSMRKVTEAESFGEAAGAFLSSPVENLANVGPESVVQYAPAAPALAAASMAGGPALAAALAGFYSQKIDEKSTMAGAVSEEAKDATEAGSVLGVLRDATKMGQMGEKALAHSIPVGILDGLSLGLAGKTFLPNKIVSAFSEGGKRWAHFGTQAVAQGAMGGTGEALGQVAAEGKVTNWGDVVAEIAGEGFGAPVEIATISAKNWAQAKQTQAIAQQQKQVRQATVEAIQNNKLLERDTETAKEYIKQVGEASGVSEVVFDSEVLRQEEGVSEALLKHFPGKADEINRALENGGSVSIPVEDAFVAIKQDPEFANAYVEHAEIKGVPGEALAAEDAEVAQDTMKSSTQAAMGSASEQTVSELKEINGVIETALEGLLGSKEKAKAGTALFSTLVSNMAEDLGVSPKQFWETHGVKKFVGPEGETRLNRQDVLAQSGLSEEQKAFAEKLLPQGELHASNLKEAVQLAKSRGMTLTNSFDGRQANLTRNGLDKMKSAKAVQKSVSPKAHIHALANLAELYEKAVRLWSYEDKKPPKDNAYDILAMHRYVALMPFGDAVYPVKITVKEFSDKGKGSSIYTLEAVEVDDSTSLREWVQAGSKEDNSNSAPATLTENISQIFDALRKAGETYKQGVKGGYLARAKEIIFSKDADMSTVAHEFGHFFLDAYLDTAFGLDATGELTAGRKHVLDNAGGVLKWLGVDSSKWAGMSVEERRPYHEKFARTFEAYLWEGHAPGKSLASVFRRFKAWLRKVYAVIAAIPEAEMNDDVRNLMDSLLVAHNAVEEAKARRALSGVAAVLAENMRGDPSISPVMEALRERDEAAEEWLLAKLLKDAAVLGRMRTAKYKELQKEASRVYSDYTDRELEKLRKEPETKLYNLLTSGIERNGKRIRPKLVEGELKSLGLTEAQISELKDRNMIYDPEVDGQVPANGEDLAREYGYTSYSHMAVAMSQAAEPIDRARVNASKRLSDEASPFASPDGLRKAADIAVMNEAQERVLINTIRAVDKTYKISAQERAWFHELAERQLGGMRLKDIKPEAFRQRAALRGKDALKAIKNNDPIAAGRALRQQLYQTILAREAQKLQGRRAKFLAQAKRLNKKEVKTLETKYLIMIQAILDKAGIKIKADFLRDRVPLASFMQTCFEEQEAVPAVDPNFENELAGVNGDFASMTGETFNRLCDTVDVLLKYGKDAKLVRLGNEAIELSEVKTKLESALEASSEAHGRERKGDMEKTGMAARALNWVHQVGLSHARMQSVFKVFDDGKAGAFFDFLIRPTDEAAATETRLKREFTRKMAEAFRPLYAKGVMGLEHAVYHESVGVSVTRGQVIAMALNMGNQGNAARLVGGSHLWKEITKGRELTEADVLTLISETLTKEELEAVQKVWDVFEDMRPRLHEQQKRLTGRTPKWVEPRPLIVRLPNGELVTLKGGYYPIMYDSRASDRGAAVAELRNAFAGSAGTPKGTHTYGGFLETRAKKVKNLAVALTPQAGFDGLDNAIHRLAWEEATINAWKVFKAVRPMIRDIYGADMVKAIETWLKANALGDLVQAAPGEEIARFARHGVSMAGLGFNVVTAIIQLPGIINSVPNIGSRWVGKGVSQFLAMGPKNAAEFVRAKSEMMTDRATTQFRELSEIQGLAAGTTGEAKNKFMNLAYKPIVIMQTAVDVPTWLGAYNKALSEGNTDDRAVAIADRAVLDAQGSGRASDLSAIERSGAWAKLFTVFYTFFNAILNNLVVSGKTKNKLNFAFDLVLVIGVQTVIEQMLREGLKEAAGSGNGDDYWDRVLSASGKGVVSFSAGMLVGVREFSSIVDGYDYKGPTGMRKVNDVIRLTQQIGQGEVDEALVKSAVSAFGSFFGIPSAPINRAISGGNALRKGKTDSWLAPFLGYSEH